MNQPVPETASALTLGQMASLACLYEVTAPKPGNVHRGADFEDVSFFDFATSAIAIAPIINHARCQSLGQTILQSIRATHARVGSNTNLGMVLLIAPLAAAETAERDALRCVLQNLDASDATDVYQAIRSAAPGALGTSDQWDVHDNAGITDLIAAMQFAAARDMIAYQYANDFETVFDHIVPDLTNERIAGNDDDAVSLSDRIVHAHVRQMARTPDSLIARKCGKELAQQSADRAARVLASGEIGSSAYAHQLADLDFWLRSDGHRRNPGTTADLIAAGLFVALRRDTLPAGHHR